MKPSDRKTILITGAAGFIGSHLARHYHRQGQPVICTDRHRKVLEHEHPIYLRRIDLLRKEGIQIIAGDLTNETFVDDLMSHLPEIVIHLAAHANVRDPNKSKFIENINVFKKILKAADQRPPEHFLYASSSSVYGGKDTPRPFSESTELSSPNRDAYYARSKYLSEKLANRAANFPTTGMRFFNVYGPWGRAEMAPFEFADSLACGRKTSIFNVKTRRTWTYIDDVIAIINELVKIPPNGKKQQIVNVAGPELVKTEDVLDTIAKIIDVRPYLEKKDSKVSELDSNPADTRLLKSLIGDIPKTCFNEGIEKFLEWYFNEWYEPECIMA